MMASKLKCRRCEGSMEVGFVADRAYAGKSFQHLWVPGAPEKSFLKGTKPKTGSMPMLTYRCRDCGCLESFAGEQAQ